MWTREEYKIGLDQDKRAEYLRGLSWSDLERLIDKETEDEVNEFAECELLKRGFGKNEIDEWGWDEFADKEAFDVVQEFTIDLIVAKNLDLK